MKNIESRRSFAIVCFGLIALFSILICGFGNESQTTTKIGLTIIALISLTLMFLVLTEKSADLIIEFGKKFKFIFRPQKGGKYTVDDVSVQLKGKTVQALVGISSTISQYQDIDKLEKLVLEKFFEIINNDASSDKYSEALDFLDEYNFVVQESWRLKLNEGRCNALCGQLSKAQKNAEYVIKNFPDNREAAGCAYEVFAFTEELDETQGNFENRKKYVMKGLEYLPNRPNLLFHAFDIAIMQGNIDEALNYLRKVTLADAEFTKEMLALMPIVKEAKKLSPKLKKAIKEVEMISIIDNKKKKGEKKMCMTKAITTRVSFMVLAVAVTFCSVVNNNGFYRIQVDAFTFNQTLIATSLIKKVEKSIYPNHLRCDIGGGTSMNKS